MSAPVQHVGVDNSDMNRTKNGKRLTENQSKSIGAITSEAELI